MKLFLTKEEANILLKALDVKEFFEPESVSHDKIKQRILECLEKQQR